MDAEAMEQPCGCQAGGRAGGPVGPQGWNRDTIPPLQIGAPATTTSNMHASHTNLAVACA